MTFACAALGTLTFPADALVNPPIRKQVFRGSTQTVSGSRVDDRGVLVHESGLIGLALMLEWDIMDAAFFSSLRSYYEHSDTNAGIADPVVFDPGVYARVASEKYKVRIASFNWDEDHFVHDYVMKPAMRLIIRGVAP